MSTLIEARNISKRFGTLLAVDNLSLQATSGQILGLLGPNGAGKSTTIRILCRLIRPDSGTVTINGNPYIGFCPQEIAVWPNLTCIENLEFMGEMYKVNRTVARQRGTLLLRRVGLSEKLHHLPKTLSGGMLRRLNIAMAMIHDPEIVILDEPEAGLDSQSRVMMREFIKELSLEKAVIVTTHNMDEAERLAHQIAVIDRGKLIAEGTPSSLKKLYGGGEILELSFESEHKAAAAQIAVASISRTAHIVQEEARVTIKIPNALLLLPDIINTLSNLNLVPASAGLRESTLEDVFIALTGRGLRD